MKRNNVVIHKSKQTFYGRVIRTLPESKVMWLCCGLHFHITHKDDLEISTYNGYIDHRGRHVPMTSIRQLKKRARQFHGKYAHKTPLDYEFIIFD